MGTMRKKTLGIFNLSSVAFLLACLIGIQPIYPTISPSPYNELAPSSKWQSDELQYDGPLNIVRFANQPSATLYRRPTSKQLKAEIKQLALTFVIPLPEEGINKEDLESADLSPIDGELFLISDIHIAGKKRGGLKDWKYIQLLEFLDKVALENGNLVINGDFFESYFNKKDLFDHLKLVYKKIRKIKRVIFLTGNHDALLQAFHGKRWKNISFLDSITIPVNGDVIHIEHGHKTDWWWHHIVEAEEAPFYIKPFSWFGKKIIKMAHEVEGHGFALSLRWVQFASVFKFVLVVPIFLQLVFMDLRIREVRSQMPKKFGIKEKKIPFFIRIFIVWEWIKQVKRLWWEFKVPKKEPRLHFVIGHYHDGDLIILSFLKWLFDKWQTRVKIHFTAGRWISLSSPMRLKFTRITPSGKITKENVENFLPIGKAKREGFYTRNTGRFSFPSRIPIQVITPIETSL